jgi:transmembrane sensor
MNTIEQAAEWFMRLRESELTDAERKQFTDWLAEAPVNVREYLGTAEVWGALQTPNIWPTESKEDLLEAIRQARDANVFTLKANGENPGDSEILGWPAATTQRWRWPVPFALAAGVMFIAFFVWSRIDLNTTTYRTARGEQRSIVLADGSIVQLNTLSKLVVHFDQKQRRIELPQGEALFRVAHDRARPFDVRTQFAIVRAVGTEFDVYNRKEGTHVAVIEGRVIVGSAAELLSSAIPDRNSRPQNSTVTTEHSPDIGVGIPLAAGQQITVSPAAAPKPTPANATAATAWIQRRIVLDNDEIATAIAEFNRYNHTQMQVRGTGLAGLRITGVFNADDPSALVKYLKEVQGVQADEIDGELILQR